MTQDSIILLFHKVVEQRQFRTELQYAQLYINSACLFIDFL